MRSDPNRERTCWFDLDRVCPRCGAQLITDGVGEWCSNFPRPLGAPLCIYTAVAQPKPAAGVDAEGSDEP